MGRSIKKGPYIDEKLLRKVQKMEMTKEKKIIKTWEGDEWNSLLGPLKMRACDHQAIMDMYATEFVHPNKWFEDFAYYGKVVRIPAKYVTQPIPKDLERCKK